MIQAEGIRAAFVPYGAAISDLFINDTHGVERDIVLGWDNASYYSIDKQHNHLGSVPGPYANRIKNSSFELDGETYQLIPNDWNNNDTLHGGPNGWDYRNWTVVAYTPDSITFSLFDTDGAEGFPGDRIAYAQYSVTPYSWHIAISAISLTKRTPIMLTSHPYWNLDGYQNPATADALDHELYLPFSGTRIGLDSIEIPTGDIVGIQPGDVHDWWQAPKRLGQDIDRLAEENCGGPCEGLNVQREGYDNAYLINREAGGNYDWREKGPVATLASPWSGIQVDIFTDQDGFQVYSCNTLNSELKSFPLCVHITIHHADHNPRHHVPEEDPRSLRQPQPPTYRRPAQLLRPRSAGLH